MTPEPKKFKEIADDWKNQALEQADIQEIKRTPEPKTDEVENLVEQLFQYYDDIDCAETVDQRITAKEQAEFWLKRTLQNQADKHSKHEQEMYETLDAEYQHQMKLQAEEAKREREESVKEAIRLSDDAERGHETEFNEWRAFKGFRNGLRDWATAYGINLEGNE